MCPYSPTQSEKTRKTCIPIVPHNLEKQQKHVSLQSHTTWKINKHVCPHCPTQPGKHNKNMCPHSPTQPGKTTNMCPHSYTQPGKTTKTCVPTVPHNLEKQQKHVSPHSHTTWRNTDMCSQSHTTWKNTNMCPYSPTPPGKLQTCVPTVPHNLEKYKHVSPQSHTTWKITNMCPHSPTEPGKYTKKTWIVLVELK